MTPPRWKGTTPKHRARAVSTRLSPAAANRSKLPHRFQEKCALVFDRITICRQPFAVLFVEEVAHRKRQLQILVDMPAETCVHRDIRIDLGIRQPSHAPDKDIEFMARCQIPTAA